MENKEIYIDGVNVAWCKDYDDGTCCNDDVLTLSCEKANCMYKQLQRLEQENKALKDNNNHLQAIIDDGRAENKRFREENKELKETIKQYCEWLDEERESNDKLQKVYQNDHCDLLNYRSALEEIRNIEELAYYSKGMPEEPLSQCDFMLDAINNYEQRRIKILTKINECLGE